MTAQVHLNVGMAGMSVEQLLPGIRSDGRVPGPADEAGANSGPDYKEWLLAQPLFLVLRAADSD